MSRMDNLCRKRSGHAGVAIGGTIYGVADDLDMLRRPQLGRKIFATILRQHCLQKRDIDVRELKTDVSEYWLRQQTAYQRSDERIPEAGFRENLFAERQP